MNVKELFEKPLPHLSVDCGEIASEATDVLKGAITVTNTGGGELTGSVLSNSPYVLFSPSKFSGKKTVISYAADVSAFKPGEVLKTSGVIMSSGGEKVLPVRVKVLPLRYVTPNGAKVSSLLEFSRHAAADPENAQTAFFSDGFAAWLSDLGYPYMDAFNEIKKDTLRGRALDNFLILNRLKNPCAVSAVTKKISLTLNPYKNETASGVFELEKKGAGFIDVALVKQNGAPWLTLDRERLTAGDFNENGVASVNFFAQPDLLGGDIAEERVLFGAAGEVVIKAEKCLPVRITLSGEYFKPSDTGFIHAENHTGSDVLIAVSASDPAVRFEKASYLVGHKAKIPFAVKFSALAMATRAISRKARLAAAISVAAQDAPFDFRRTFKIVIGANENSF